MAPLGKAEASGGHWHQRVGPRLPRTRAHRQELRLNPRSSSTTWFRSDALSRLWKARGALGALPGVLGGLSPARATDYQAFVTLFDGFGFRSNDVPELSSIVPRTADGLRERPLVTRRAHV